MDASTERLESLSPDEREKILRWGRDCLFFTMQFNDPVSENGTPSLTEMAAMEQRAVDLVGTLWKEAMQQAGEPAAPQILYRSFVRQVLEWICDNFAP